MNSQNSISVSSRKRISHKRQAKGFSRSGKEWEESIASHIGKIIDGSNAQQLAETGVLLGCAAMGYWATKDPLGALVGAVGYKLATTMGGTPPASQIAGLAILGGLGLVSLYPFEQRAKAIALAQEIAKAPDVDKPYYNEWVMAQVTGSTILGYCEWVSKFYPDVKAKVCQKGSSFG